MKIRQLLSSQKTLSVVQLLLIVILFCSMLVLFVCYVQLRLGSLGLIRLPVREEFPSDKMWIFSDTSRLPVSDNAEASYVYPVSITFRHSGKTSDVLRQKSSVLNVYNDILQYVGEVLGPQYRAQPVQYDDYCNIVKSADYTLLSYSSELPSYILRLCCAESADGFYQGQPCRIKKLLLTGDQNERLLAYAIDSNGNPLRFEPLNYAAATAYPVNNAVISAYNNTGLLVDAQMIFESEYFASKGDGIAPDIVLQPGMQFYDIGITNTLSFINGMTAEDSLIKNDKILSILRSFKINTGLVRHYTDVNVIYFVESNALLEMSSDGYMNYSGEGGGIPLSKILNRDSGEYSAADKLTAASLFIGGFGSDIVCGNGEFMLTNVEYDTQSATMRFEFCYSFDSLPLLGLDKATVEIKDGSVTKAHIPTYGLFRHSVRKINLIAPEIAYSATDVSQSRVSDYTPVYITLKNKLLANVGWAAVT